jgi:hypothetical protein
MRFGTWNVKRFYTAGSLVSVPKELSKYRLDFVGVPEGRLEGGGTEPEREYTFLYGKGNKNHELGTGFLCIKVEGLERGPLSLVSTTEELLDRKVAAPVQKIENTVVGIRHADHVAPSIRKSWQSLRRQAAVAWWV